MPEIGGVMRDEYSNQGVDMTNMHGDLETDKMTDQTKPLLPDMPDELCVCVVHTHGDGSKTYECADTREVKKDVRYVRADRPVSGDMKVAREAEKRFQEFCDDITNQSADFTALAEHMGAFYDMRDVFRKAFRALEQSSRIEAAQSSGVPAAGLDIVRAWFRDNSCPADVDSVVWDVIERLIGNDAPHADDVAVDRFAAAMKDKMRRSREKGRSGWDDPAQCTTEYLAHLLNDHVAKGDPVDVGNLAMMLFIRGGGTVAPKADTKTGGASTLVDEKR